MGHRIPYPCLLAGTIVAMAGNVLTPSTHLGGEPGKIIDLSPEAFRILEPLGRGVLHVRLSW